MNNLLDDFRSTNITWDKATSRIYSPITANESDENGRKLVVQVVNGGQVEDLTGASLHLYWETIDKLHYGLDVFKAVDLKKGEFELSYTKGMLSNKGVLNANLVLIYTGGRVVSERFKITVTEGIDNDEIQSENSFSSLTQALIDLNNKVDKGGNEQITYAMLAQDVKTQFTGGNTAVVGTNAVNTTNIVDNSVTYPKLSTEFQDDYISKTGFPLKNKVKNFDFLTGATNWNYLGGTISVTNKKATITGNGTHTFIRISQVCSMVKDVKYFVKAKAEVVGTSCLSLQITWFDGTTTHVIDQVSNPLPNTSYILSGEFIGKVDNVNAQIILVANYVDTATTNGKQLVAENISIIDLYETYGKDNEPISKGEYDTFTSSNNVVLSEAIKNDVGKFVKNELRNGDFSNGITNWNYLEGTLTVSNNTARLTASGAASEAILRQIKPGSYVAGNRLYYKAKVRVTNNVCQRIDITPSSSYGGAWGTKQILNPKENQWYDISNVYTLLNTTQPNDTLIFPVGHFYSDSTTANGKTMEVQSVVVLDLTKIFGKGEEPTVSEMDAILDRHKDRFISIDGKMLVSSSDVYSDNIDKTRIRPKTTYGSMIEHEWQTSLNGHWVSPKMFVCDSNFDIYSSIDYGKTWKHETYMGHRINFQISNATKRLVIKAPSSTQARDAIAKIYTKDWKLLSEKTGIHGVYGSDSLDVKPDDDNVFVFAEYLQGGDSVNGVNIYRTEDAGLTWTSVLNLTDVVHIHSIRFDPFNPNHVYATTGDAGVEMRNRWYKSIDSGKTWQLIAGGSLNGGQTPMVDGTFDYDKYMRTTTTVMGVDTGTKGRNSIYFFHDNSPASFVRFDKTSGKFQHITGDLPGVAYGTTMTKDGMFTIVEQPNGANDLLHFVKFPELDDDIDNPSKYEVYSVELPRSGMYQRQIWSRQQDVAGGILIGSNSGNMGRSLLGERNVLASKINFSWTSDGGTTKRLNVGVDPILTIPQ